jgi:hypothetical protein
MTKTANCVNKSHTHAIILIQMFDVKEQQTRSLETAQMRFLRAVEAYRMMNNKHTENYKRE